MSCPPPDRWARARTPPRLPPRRPCRRQSVWFKADAITGLSNGAKVGTWNDSSGNNNPATNAASARQPAYVAAAINGLPGVRFTAANSNWLAFARPVQDDFTLLVVFQSTQGLGTGTLFWEGAGLVSGEVNGPTNDFGISLNAERKPPRRDRQSHPAGRYRRLRARPE